MHDLIVLGGSAAGITAAIYAARRKVNLKLITEDFGGEIALTADVENFPGFNSISGRELAQKMKEQLVYNNVEIEEGYRANKIEKINNGFKVFYKNLSNEEKNLESKTVIIATGAHPKHLGVPGEDEFYHRGLTYCALCDAPLFKNKTVAVVGGGNTAIGSALMLSEFTVKTYIVSTNPQLRGENVLLEKIAKNSKIEVINNAQTLRILGERLVNGLEYNDQTSGAVKKLDLQGVFVSIGYSPNSEFVDLVEKNERGEIVVFERGTTSLPGIFAAGDVTNGYFKQYVIAAGQGATAALGAIEYLNKN